MEKRLFRRLAALAPLASAGLATALSLVAGSAFAQPNLVPQLTYPMNASVGVQNTGDTAAGPSHLTINCTKFGKAVGGCPEAPGMAAYVDPAFPNRVVIDVPALQPGQSFNHNLAFWGAMPWTPGTYVFDAVADAGNEVAESNEANNAVQSSYTQLAGLGVAPKPPLPLAARPARPERPTLTSSTIFLPKRQQPAEPTRLPHRLLAK